jgi:hypothetical protein
MDWMLRAGAVWLIGPPLTPRVVYANEWLLPKLPRVGPEDPNSHKLLLAMPNLGTHSPLLSSDLASPFSCLLRTHKQILLNGLAVNP